MAYNQFEEFSKRPMAYRYMLKTYFLCLSQVSSAKLPVQGPGEELRPPQGSRVGVQADQGEGR